MEQVKTAALSESDYAKRETRTRLAALPYPEKVRLVVEMQKRVAPIYRARGKIIKPWEI